jgi:hypothetical protein
MALSPTAALSPTFTAVVRWRGPDPTIELETRHPGFRTPEDAALFANAFSPNAPLGLRLASKTDLQLLMVDGHYFRWIGGEVTVWALTVFESDSDGFIIANDNDFEAKSFLEYPFPATAFGDYEQAQYGVLDHEGELVDLVLDWDDQDRLRITVHQDATDEEVKTLFYISTHPDA